MPPPLAELLLDALPQTQCTRCGYPDCRAYAEAIAREGVPINRCPPGGAEGVARLARLTGQAARPLDEDCGFEAPRRLALIDEAWCIGCTLCIQACPVDCIVGAAKQMHTVIEPLCTGCELCVPVCPVDCIELLPVSAERTGWAAWSAAQALEARDRHERRQQRLRREARDGTAPLDADPTDRADAPSHRPEPAADVDAQPRDTPGRTAPAAGLDPERKRALAQAALERARSRVRRNGTGVA